MLNVLKWGFGLLLLISAVGIPALYWRMHYDEHKRVREVTAGRFYRSGQMTEQRLREFIRQHGIKTVINLQDENPDPALARNFFGGPKTPESLVCQQEGANYILLSWEGDLGLIPREEATPEVRPKVIDHFLEIIDREENYPILIHCLAGLHRTGRLVAVYRMEKENWTLGEAIQELKANGYGDRKCTIADDYLYTFFAHYKPGLRKKTTPKN